MSRQERYFEIGRRLDNLIHIVESVPGNWTEANGVLHAPTELLESQLATKNVRWLVNPNLPSNFLEIMHQLTLPTAIDFKQGSVDISQQIAIKFLEENYWGGLKFFRKYPENQAIEASCALTLNPLILNPLTTQHLIEELIPVPLMSITWYPENSSDIDPIIAACEALHLVEPHGYN